jgi:CheY-like chemotaxis protein
LTTCAVKASDVPAELGLARGDYVTVAVHDTGEGMSPEVTARAFEPFFTTKEIGKGSGLGLSMVYGFAQQSGGGVRLESRPGAGTCVTLYLPAAAVDAERGEAVAEDKPGAGSGVVLDVSITILKSHGYRVLVARDGPEALGILRHQVTIDLMFTDLVMPGGISGAALAREAQLIRPDLKVLLTTGYAGLSVSEAEQFPLLAKPFRPGELAAAVAALVGQQG